MLTISDKRLEPITRKLAEGQRLTFEDGLVLYESHDLPAIGNLANQVRERLHGNRTYYNINLHINPTNTCFVSCRFCAFGRKAFDENSYILTPGEIAERARKALPEGATEIHLVGGLDPRLKINYYCGYIQALKDAFPHIHIKTLTPVEVVYIAKISKITVRETIERLREAGMDSMPGGGAEIFDPEIREQLCEHKCDAGQWFETHREIHRLGMRTNCTMLIGHIEQPRHRVDHLLRLRTHQDEWASHDADGNLLTGFQCFIPLSFHPANTALSHLPGPTGFDELRNIAVSRLLLDNIPHIKAYWIMLGIKQAQIAQWFGADDMDGTVTHEEIYHDAGAETPQGMTVAELRRLIRDCGREPIERDSLYNETARVQQPAGGC
ncbi:aminofutalosine synthase MqnE [Candidatus Poribacteria bacterium]|nr:aminofutalosine synthase MqnE [Candidatus Poribacteria bacterium]